VLDFYDVANDCTLPSLQSTAFRAGIALDNASAAGIVPGTRAIYLTGRGRLTFPIVDPQEGNRTSRCHIMYFRSALLRESLCAVILFSFV
jgi:hypothetical protein